MAETPKQKRIDIPKGAKNEIALMNVNLKTYIAGMVAGMNIEGNWAFDLKSNQIVVEDKEDFLNG